MKPLTILFVMINLACFSQEADTVKTDSICLERGHAQTGFMTRTLLYCESYIIDTDSTTIKVYPACNYTKYTCSRCGKQITEADKERRVVIWKREP